MSSLESNNKKSRSALSIDNKRMIYGVIKLLLISALTVFMMQELHPFMQFINVELVKLAPLAWLKFMKYRFFFNMLLYFLMYLLLYLLPGFRITGSVVTIGMFFFGWAQHHVVINKKQIIFPWDIYNLRLVGEISSQYKVIINVHVIISFLIMLLILCLIVVGRPQKIHRKMRLILIVTVAFLNALYFMGFVLNPALQKKAEFYYATFISITNSTNDGIFFNFFHYINSLENIVPEDYSQQRALDILERYSQEDALPAIVDKKPDVIVVLNESFTDYEDYLDLPTNENVLPFYHNLSGANLVKKSLFLSVLGGSTANTEAEILTSQTMAFYPQDSYPFIQYFDHPIDALPELLRAEGYRTMAIHPFEAFGWKRPTVYPFMGIDTFLTIEMFDNPEKVRNYASDLAAYEYLTAVHRAHKKNDPDVPIFQYLVTMQNHSGYATGPDALPIQIDTDKYVTELVNYLNLLHISDAALKELIDYYQTSPDPVVLVFFGDHQAIWADEGEALLNQLAANSRYDLEVHRYVTPIMIWANFDISDSYFANIDQEIMSPNYIAPLIADLTGMDTPYYRFLRDMYSHVPAINARGIMDAEGHYYELNSEDIPDDIQKWVDEYAVLQYYQLMNRAE